MRIYYLLIRISLCFRRYLFIHFAIFIFFARSRMYTMMSSTFYFIHFYSSAPLPHAQLPRTAIAEINDKKNDWKITARLNTRRTDRLTWAHNFSYVYRPPICYGSMFELKKPIDSNNKNIVHFDGISLWFDFMHKNKLSDRIGRSIKLCEFNINNDQSSCWQLTSGCRVSWPLLLLQPMQNILFVHSICSSQ